MKAAPLHLVVKWLVESEIVRPTTRIRIRSELELESVSVSESDQIYSVI